MVDGPWQYDPLGKAHQVVGAVRPQVEDDTVLEAPGGGGLPHVSQGRRVAPTQGELRRAAVGEDLAKALGHRFVDEL